MNQSARSDAGEFSARDGDTETETMDTIDSVANVGRDQVSHDGKYHGPPQPPLPLLFAAKVIYAGPGTVSLTCVSSCLAFG